MYARLELDEKLKKMICLTHRRHIHTYCEILKEASGKLDPVPGGRLVCQEQAVLVKLKLRILFYTTINNLEV